MEWFKMKILNILRTEHISIKKNRKLYFQDYIFKRCHLLVEVTFKLYNFSLFVIGKKSM